MPTDHSLSASSQLAAHKVASCQDLLTEIISRLPVRSLIRFKSINKQWYSLLKCHRNPDPPSGLFVPVFEPKLGYVFVPFDHNNRVKFPFTTLSNIDPDANYLRFRHSCNGLMLCSKTSDKELITDKHYVYNPTINQLTTLPGPGKYESGMNLAFDPSKSPYYKIIYVYPCLHYNGSGDDYHSEIHMYSSQTRTCKLSYKLRIHRDADIVFTSGVYWNNAIHWIDRFGFIVYFDLDQEITYEIKTPFARFGLNHMNYRSYIFESRDQLLLVEIYCPLITEFKIYELNRDYADWLVKYHVDLEEFGGSLFPESMNPTYFELRSVLEFDVLCLVLGGDDAESFLVVETPRKIMRLNLDSKTCHTLCDFTCPRITSYVPWLYQWPHVYPFAMSLYSF